MKVYTSFRTLTGVCACRPAFIFSLFVCNECGASQAPQKPKYLTQRESHPEISS